MILLVDVGNSRLKWSYLGDEGLDGQTRIEYRPTAMKSTLNAAWGALPVPTRVVVSNVAGEKVVTKLGDWVTAKWGVEPEIIQARAEQAGVRNAYREPERLGADRWAVLLATRARSRGAACVVDCGTAVTIDALSRNGEHLGGLILPGLAMSREALIRSTDGIGEVSGGDVSLLARSTRDGVVAGTLYALVAAIDRIAGDVCAELGRSTARVLTGGDAEELLPLLDGSWELRRDLVLEGLAVVATEEAADLRKRA